MKWCSTMEWCSTMKWCSSCKNGAVPRQKVQYHKKGAVPLNGAVPQKVLLLIEWNSDYGHPWLILGGPLKAASFE